MVEAEAELRAVVAAQPANAHARVALGEALLSQGRFADAAAETADGRPPRRRCAAAAAAHRLFALLVRAARRADAQLRHRRWPTTSAPCSPPGAAVRAGAGAPAALPAGAAPPVLVMLEAPSRACRTSTRSRTSPPCSRPSRSRGASAARCWPSVYLRRGFLESAAEEWIAVCEQGGADADALRGLAAVADARGLDEDAEVFAAEAETLAAA